MLVIVFNSFYLLNSLEYFWCELYKLIFNLTLPGSVIFVNFSFPLKAGMVYYCSSYTPQNPSMVLRISEWVNNKHGLIDGNGL